MRGRDALWVLAFVLASASLQAIQTVPFDGDTAYHVAVARLIAAHGVLHEFPWTPFSSLADRYADKELFFHFLLVPVSQLSYPLAAKLVGTLLGALLLGVFYWILREEKVEYPGLWTAAMFVASGAFLMRFALVRPHLLSITLLMAVAWAAIHEKRKALGVLCFVYPFCYIAWHAVLSLLVLVEGTRFLSQRTISVRNLGVGLAAVALAVLAHPNFPANTEVFWIANVEVLGKAWGNEPGFALGGELAAMSPSAVLRFLAFPILVVGMALVPALRRRAENLPGLAFLVAAIAFLGLTFRTERFVEYSVPFSFLAAATSLRSWRQPVLLPLIAAAAVTTWLVGSQRLREDFPLRRELFPSNQTETVRKLVPEGAQVFTCGHELTGEMMIALPERKFLVALDPVFFWVKDAELYRTWLNLVRQPPADVVNIIRTRFHAGFVLCEARPQHIALIRTLFQSPGVRTAHQIGPWALFALDDSSGGAAAATHAGQP